MVVGISPHYIRITRRFIQNVGPKSIAALSKDSGLSEEVLEKFGETGELDPLDVMKLWGLLFSEMTPLQATVVMDQKKFDPLRE